MCFKGIWKVIFISGAVVHRQHKRSFLYLFSFVPPQLRVLLKWPLNCFAPMTFEQILVFLVEFMEADWILIKQTADFFIFKQISRSIQEAYCVVYPSSFHYVLSRDFHHPILNFPIRCTLFTPESHFFFFESMWIKSVACVD